MVSHLLVSLDSLDSVDSVAPEPLQVLFALEVGVEELLVLGRHLSALVPVLLAVEAVAIELVLVALLLVLQVVEWSERVLVAS